VPVVSPGSRATCSPLGSFTTAVRPIRRLIGFPRFMVAPDVAHKPLAPRAIRPTVPVDPVLGLDVEEPHPSGPALLAQLPTLMCLSCSFLGSVGVDTTRLVILHGQRREWRG
jgi:hypothetical protein